jgi:hypothetical protein
MTVLLKNNASGFLAASISATDTSVILTTGTGANFPTLGSGEYFYATIAPTSGASEIVKCTARSGDTLVVVRAQEGTSALSFAGGSRVELRVTAQSVIDAINDRVALKDQASEISIADAGGYYTGTNVEVALQEAALASTTRYNLGELTSIARSVESRLQDSASVLDYIPVAQHAAIKARTSTYDASADIQKAVDEVGCVFFPAGTYVITTPIQIAGGDAVKLLGEGAERSVLSKATTTTGSGSNTSRGGAVTDSYVKNAMIIIKHPDNGYNYNTTIKGLTLSSVGYTVEYGIYAPRVTHLYLEDVSTYQCKIGFYTNDAWLVTMLKCIFNGNTIRFAGNNYGWASGSRGVVYANDGTNVATGTTLNAICCWTRDVHVGWDLYGLQYSALHGCASDNITESAFDLQLCDITLNGCGMENVQIATRAIWLDNGSYVLNHFRGFAVRGNPAAGTHAYIWCDNSASVTFNNCQFDDFSAGTAGLSANIIIQSGAKVFRNQTVFPTSGNAFISYSSDASMLTYGGTDLFLTDSTAARQARYMDGRLRDNEVQQRSAKAIDAGGTVIATLTAGVSICFGVCEFTVAWSDTSFPSGAGISKFLVAVHKDGVTYRESVSAATSAYANNGGAGVPAYALSRVGDVWSLTMTPQDGACTVHTLTAEMQNITGFTLALP